MKLIKIIPVLIIFILASCSISGSLRTNFKMNTESNYGLLSAIYEDRVYYVSNEYSKTGIYSMKKDGTDVRLEVHNPSVIRLKLSNGILYYNGLYTINKNENSNQMSAVNNNTIYCYQGGITQKTEYVDLGFNILNFYISGAGNKAICYGATQEEMALLDNESKMIDRRNYSDKKTTISFEYNKETIQSDIYKITDFIILSRHFSFDYDYEKFAANEYPYVIDINTGELVATYENSESRYDECKALYMDNSNIYCAYNNMVIILDRTTYKVKTNFIIGDSTNDYNIEYVIKRGDNIYIVAGKWTRGKYSIPSLLCEKLYTLNPNSYECNEISLSPNKRILRVDENYIILLESGIIYKGYLKDGVISDKQKLIDVPPDIYSTNYTIDYAGDWMFIYKIYPETGSFYYGERPGQQLVYKINLQFGQVIKNDVKLDFSILDSYIAK